MILGSFYISVAYIIPFTAEQYSIVYVYYIFIHSFIGVDIWVVSAFKGLWLMLFLMFVYESTLRRVFE